MADRSGGKIVNRSGLAETLGMSLPAVDAYVRRGCPFVQRGAKGREWQFDTAAVIEWLRQQDIEQAIGDTSKLDIDEARRRKIAAEAALAEMELAKERRQMIHVDEVAGVVADEYAKVRSRVLAMPARLAQPLSILDDPAAIEAEIKAECVDALSELVADGGNADEDRAGGG